MLAVVSGPFMGGPSISSKLIDSETSLGIKIVGVPFAYVGGTIGGIFPALFKGMIADYQMTREIFKGKDQQYGDAMVQIFDPFNAGFFKKKEADPIPQNQSLLAFTKAIKEDGGTVSIND